MNGWDIAVSDHVFKVSLKKKKNTKKKPNFLKKEYEHVS